MKIKIASWATAVLGGAIVTVAVEGGLIAGWLGAIAVGIGTIVVSVGVNMVAFDIRQALGKE